MTVRCCAVRYSTVRWEVSKAQPSPASPGLVRSGLVRSGQVRLVSQSQCRCPLALSLPFSRARSLTHSLNSVIHSHSSQPVNQRQPVNQSPSLLVPGKVHTRLPHLHTAPPVPSTFHLACIFLPSSTWHLAPCSLHLAHCCCLPTSFPSFPVCCALRAVLCCAMLCLVLD